MVTAMWAESPNRRSAGSRRRDARSPALWSAAVSVASCKTNSLAAAYAPRPTPRVQRQAIPGPSLSCGHPCRSEAESPPIPDSQAAFRACLCPKAECGRGCGRREEWREKKLMISEEKRRWWLWPSRPLRTAADVAAAGAGRSGPVPSRLRRSFIDCALAVQTASEYRYDLGIPRPHGLFLC